MLHVVLFVSHLDCSKTTMWYSMFVHNVEHIIQSTQMFNSSSHVVLLRTTPYEATFPVDCAYVCVCSSVSKTSVVIGCCWLIYSSHRCSTAPKCRCYSTTFVDTPTTRTNNRCSKSRSRNSNSPSVNMISSIRQTYRDACHSKTTCRPLLWSPAVANRHVIRCRADSPYEQ